MEEKLFHLTNFVVLMNYDYSQEPDQYTEISNKAIEKLLSVAETYNGKVMIGVPAIATHREFQYKVSKTDLKDRADSGYTMADYLSGALKGCQEMVNKMGSKCYVGCSIWALHSESEPVGFAPVRSKYVYYPSTIGLKEWELLMNATP